MVNKERLLENFLKYVKIDTQSVEGVDYIPSSPGQVELAKIVVEDLKKAGVQDIELSKECYIFATIPENLPSNHPAKGRVPTVGFSSHLDVAPEAPGAGVKARLINNYQGGKITYPANPEMVLDPEKETLLKKCIGHTVITSDGTTLLGADDKAGLAAIVEMAHYFKEHPQELHGRLRIGIMPDEETAAGSEKLDIKRFATDVAYTVDSIGFGSIDVESFNGYKGKISVKGVSAFPGYGKGVYLNAAMVLSKFVAMMPSEIWPQNCDGRQSIWWIDDFKGNIASAETNVYLRSFDLEGIKELEKILNGIKDKVLKEYPTAKVDVTVAEMYKNYRYELNKDPRVLEYADEAIKKIGVKPEHVSVRGGNDACHFCFSGLLSTNLFASFNLMHSLREWTSLEMMEKSVEALISVSKTWAEKSAK